VEVAKKGHEMKMYRYTVNHAKTSGQEIYAVKYQILHGLENKNVEGVKRSTDMTANAA